MHLTFRQGIARYQTDVYASPSFLQKNGEFIDLIVSPDPTIIVFAHKAATYVVEENKTILRAWGPFTGSATRYLYWDINLLDGALTRGFTTLVPIFSTSEPKNPSADQHWYDKTNHVMKVWVGGKWVDRVRVFAATYGSKIQPYPLGTQANEVGSFDGGNLLRDEFNKPLRQSDGTFLTTASNISVANASANTVSLEGEIVTGMAKENIPKFSLVQVDENNRLKLARSDDWRSRIIGVVTEDLYASEVGNVETDGLVKNEQWNWPGASIGRPIFCGVTGEITLVPPSHGVLQIAGYIFDRSSIFIRVQPVVILDDIRSNVVELPVGPIGTAPIADFTISETSGTAPMSVSVKNTSLHAPTNLAWDFNDDGVIDSKAEEAAFTFNTPGTYTVRLTAQNNFGKTSKTKTVTVAAPVSKSEKTNLAVQLNGPLQIAADNIFTIQVTVSNAALQNASNVRRVITIDDVNDQRVDITAMPNGTMVSTVGDTTVLTLPMIASLVTNQTVSSSFSIRAPKRPGVIGIRAGVISPEPDSSLSDNITALTVRVK